MSLSACSCAKISETCRNCSVPSRTSVLCSPGGRRVRGVSAGTQGGGRRDRRIRTCDHLQEASLGVLQAVSGREDPGGPVEHSSADASAFILQQHLRDKLHMRTWRGPRTSVTQPLGTRTQSSCQNAVLVLLTELTAESTEAGQAVAGVGRALRGAAAAVQTRRGQAEVWACQRTTQGHIVAHLQLLQPARVVPPGPDQDDVGSIRIQEDFHTEKEARPAAGEAEDEAHHARQEPGLLVARHQRTAAVAFAGVPAAGPQPGAEHVLGDVEAGVKAAVLQRNPRQRQPLEDFGGGTEQRQAAPTGHSGLADGRQRSAEGAVPRREADGDHVGAQLDGALQLQQGQPWWISTLTTRRFCSVCSSLLRSCSPSRGRNTRVEFEKTDCMETKKRKRKEKVKAGFLPTVTLRKDAFFLQTQ
ncbi:hypothetical protein EYF80_056120 [Liparis tanakae]|uniref:Uncharacterized protein n=1 Tax=Liparis tanakae TaxID=230148 RepID=A0A4Z2EXZ6_9TELE|nr:hypothetical protein EYF80_056120 [Liparis tanakae]